MHGSRAGQTVRLILGLTAGFLVSLCFGVCGHYLRDYVRYHDELIQQVKALRQDQEVDRARIRTLEEENRKAAARIEVLEIGKSALRRENVRLHAENTKLKAELRYWMARAAPGSLFQNALPEVPKPGGISGTPKVDEEHRRSGSKRSTQGRE